MFIAWLRSDEAKRIAEKKRTKAWNDFQAQYPNADLSKFKVQVTFFSKKEGKAEVYLNRADGVQTSVSGSIRKEWGDEMKRALGIAGFPIELTLNPSANKEVPAVPFHENAKNHLNEEIKISVTPNQYLKAKFREIFTRMKIVHNSGSESKRWLAGPNMSYWPQQFNFAMWCATSGCGISRELLDMVPEQIKSFLQFQIYFTTRRILFEMGGIQSTDFRFKEGRNHGLGSVFIYVTNAWHMATAIPYPGDNNFSDEGGKAAKGNLIYFIRNDNVKVKKQFEFFMADRSEGLAQAGMARLNQSIEAFVYCILGSQVDVISSILGLSGSAKEAQSEFLVLVEDAITMTDISKSVQRVQLAIDEAKVRLCLAISPSNWLMPSNLVLNTQSTVGYNNKLKKASSDMRFGVNKSVDLDMKSVGVKHMNRGSSKIKRPTSQKTSTEVQSETTNTSASDSARDSASDSASDSDTNYDKIKADRVIHRVIFNPNSASPGEVLKVPVPKLDNEVVLVPGSLALVFHLSLTGHANNFLVNNVARALVDRLTLKFAGEIVQDTDGYDLFKLWEDLFLTENERANMFREDHGAFFPRALSDELLFELRLAPAGSVVKGSDPTQLYYKLTDIQLEYEVIHSQKLADEALSKYKNGKRVMYEHITHLKTMSIDKGSDTIINESINVPRRSMKGLLLLFYETYTAGTRNSEKTFNPNITDVKLTFDGIPMKIYSQGMQARDMWEEVFRIFGKENSAMNATDFCAVSLSILEA
ncbi:hypothetical protein AWC38_SpisGene14301 [Stylophora pistillata]|uniref:Uncharacterized protein n=1 Tax=Stylophora pistillata TaxID=50429 RepID=A0A2B4RY05_STYPI|nr:hypothetical protein AWC38_SpisGene14301 [Stylophora pistillata]